MKWDGNLLVGFWSFGGLLGIKVNFGGKGENSFGLL